MRINRVKISNFGSFEGEVEFDFSGIDKDKNIILIGGKNGAGKTTLFTALKLCLYGCISWGYDAVTSSYLRRVKKLINRNSLSKKEGNSYIELDFTVEEQRGITDYILTREWKYKNQKLIENFKLFRDGKQQTGDEVDYFISYLNSLMPPQLFDLFFFDGEKISEFFLGGNTSRNLKEALLLLCGYDTFNIMRSNFRKVLHKGIDESIEDERLKYSSIYDELKENESQLEEENDRLIEIETSIKELKEKQNQEETNFRKSGGLLAQEIVQIKAEIAKEEKAREEKNEWLKEFANDMLPFIIASDLIKRVKSQVEMEQAYEKYQAVRESLNEEFIKQIVSEEIEKNSIKIYDHYQNDYSAEFSNTLAQHIDQRIKPDFDTEKFKPIHFLSHDDKYYVLSLIDSIESQNIAQLRHCREEIESSIVKVQGLRKKLELSEVNDAILQISTNIEEIKASINTLLVNKGRSEAIIEKLEKDNGNLQTKLKKAKETYDKAKKSESVLALSEKATDMFDKYIPFLIKSKIKEVKENFLYMFKQLISKHQYISEVEIDSEFNVTLYRQNITSINYIENVIDKIGLDGFVSQMGERCLSKLMEILEVKKKSEIEAALTRYDKTGSIELPMKIDIGSFSKGEQQIYIMSLYWSLIKISNNNIPFVIDTPYARIDSSHRENITTQFFTSLSSQVIILSTDEEINDQYYKLIKPFIAKEYLISYSDKDHSTYVEGKYFFEVA